VFADALGEGKMRGVLRGLQASGTGGHGMYVGSGVKRRRVLGAVALACIAIAACGGGRANIDWVPFVNAQGHQYVAVRYTDDSPVSQALLGAVVATVQKTVAGHVFDPHYRPRDGDAAYLPVGTALRAVHGFATWFRLGAFSEGRVTVYQLDRRQGRTGAELFDFNASAIQGLEIRSGLDGSVQRRVVNRALVNDFVRYIEHAPVHSTTNLGTPPTCFVGFAYADTPPITLAYNGGAGSLFPGITLSVPLRAQLAALGCR
jgi:hypothetical protein